MKKIIYLFLFIFLISFSYAQSYYYFTPQNLYKEEYQKFFSSTGLGIACNQTKNFIIYIDPLEGCQPQIIRSDLLEEQPITVFCKIKAINLNPLLNNIYIKSVSIAPINKSDIVSGIIFHSPYVGEKYLAGYLWDEYEYKSGIANFDNLGYAVILLNPVPESKMPEKVNINASARILYSAGYIFGIDRNSFIIPELSKEEWQVRFNEFSFFNGKGFIKVNKVKEDSVDIEIYKESINDPVPIKLSLTKNKPAKVNFWGFFCDNQEFEIILEDIIYPKDYARLIINGKEYLLAVGEEAEGCKIINIEKGIVSGTGEVIIECGEKISTLKIEPLNVKIKVDGKEKILTLGDKIKINQNKYAYLVCADKKNNKVYFYIGNDSASVKKEVNNIIKELDFKENFCNFLKNKENIVIFNEGKIDEKKIEIIQIFELFDKKLSEDVEEAYKKAKEKYRDIFFKYKNEKDESGEYIGAIALYELAELANEIEKKTEAINILSELIKEYEGKSNIVIKAQDKKRKLLKYVGTKKIIKNNNIWDVELISIEFPSSFDSFVELKVNEIKGNYWLGENIGRGWIITEIKDNYIVLENKDIKKEINRREILHIGEERCIEAEEEECVMNIKLTNIKIKKAAKITVKPPEMNYIAESNFSIHIGIEKRAIKIAPEKAIEMAKKLNETSKKLEEFNKKLEKIVENWKKACYIGGTALFLKNFVEGVSGESIARKIVMEGTDGKSGWTRICKEEIEKGNFKKLDECYRANEKEINKDVNEIKNLIQQINEKISKVEKECNKEECIYEKLANEYKNKKIDEINLNEFIKDSLPILIQHGYFIKDNLKDFLLELKINENEVISEKMKKIINEKIKNFVISNKRLAEEVKEHKGINIIQIPSEQIKIKVPLHPITQDLCNNLYNNNKCINKCENLYYFIGEYENELYYIIVDKSEGVPTIKCVLNKNKELNQQITNKLKEKITIEESKCNSISSNYLYASFYDRGIQKDRIGYLPIDAIKGWYIYVPNELESYDESGALAQYFLCNVGADQVPDYALYQNPDDDICIGITRNFKPLDTEYCEEKISPIMLKGENCVMQANSKKRIGKPIETSCYGKPLLIKTQITTPIAQCEDFMSPSECRILFNLCDPVLCPPSRCDFGGRYRVDNVVQTGIIGSLVLCLPNFEGGKGVIMPICLTGLYAGIEFLNKMLKETVKCLEVSVQTGQNIGICDQIKSIYICEMLWNQLFPFIKVGIPSIIEKIERKGGGEYAKFSSTWKNTFEGLQYFYQVYGETATQAFKIRSTQEVGSMICKKFLGIKYPNAASLLEEISKPELPYQFFAKVDEIPYTTVTYPPQSHYKVFYIIYAGEQDIWYSIYLRNPPQYTGIIVQPHYIIDAGFLARGQSISKSPDFIAIAGYKEICVNINGREYCGFEVSSTSYAVNFLQDKYIENQLKANIKTAKECTAGKPNLIPTLTWLNPQQGITKTLSPAIYKQGIIRICATLNPGLGVDEENWKAVGYCDDPNIRCWIYLPSVKQAIKDLGLENQSLEWIEKQHKKIVKEIEKIGIDIEEQEKIFTNTLKFLDEKIKEYNNKIIKKEIKKEDIENIENNIKKAEENITKILNPEYLKKLELKLAQLYKLKTLLLYYHIKTVEKEEEEEKKEKKKEEEEEIEEIKIIKIYIGSEYYDGVWGYLEETPRIVNYKSSVNLSIFIDTEIKTKEGVKKFQYNKFNNKEFPYKNLKFYWYKIIPIIKNEGYHVFGHNNELQLIKYNQTKIKEGDNLWSIEIDKEVGTYWYRVVVEIDGKINISSLGRPATEDDIGEFEKMLNECAGKLKNDNIDSNKLKENIKKQIEDIKKNPHNYLEPSAYEGCVGISPKVMRISRKADNNVCPKEIKDERCEFIKTIYIFKTVPFALGVRFSDIKINHDIQLTTHHTNEFMAIDCINLLLASLTYSTEEDLYKNYIEKEKKTKDLFNFYIEYINKKYKKDSIYGLPTPLSLEKIYENKYSFNNFSNLSTLKSGDVLLWAKKISQQYIVYDDTLILLQDNNENKILDENDTIIQATSPNNCKGKKGKQNGSLCILTLRDYTKNLNNNFTIVKSKLLDEK